MKEYIGQIQGKGARIGIVVGRFNELITRSLLSGAIDGLTRHGVDREDITVVWVPGAFEIPVTADKLASSGQFDALICLGAVIRGATAHFEYVAGQAAAGIAQVGRDHSLPVIFEVLTTETIEQAIERAGTKAGNKGYEGAVAAIEMVDLFKQLRQQTAQTRSDSQLSKKV